MIFLLFAKIQVDSKNVKEFMDYFLKVVYFQFLLLLHIDE